VIRWGAPHLLLLLLVVPALVAAMLASEWLTRRRLARLADSGLVPRLTDSRSPRLAAIKATCLLLGFTFLIVAAARPQWGEKLQVYHGRGIDIVLVLDASRSMLAEDVAPNRLERAKTELASLLDNLGTNRVGVVAFAGDAKVLCPLTPDVEAAKLFLDIISPDNMPKPGTNIEKAVDTAVSLFDPTDESSKAIVLVTDGESLDGDPAAAIRTAARNHVRLFAVGVGTTEGSTIPKGSDSTTTSYLKDDKGKVVVSRLAERLLIVMAKATDGRYFRSESINLDELVSALDRIQKKAIAGGEYVEYEEHFQMFLLIGFLFVLLGTLLSDRRGAWFPGLRLPGFRRPRRGASGAAGVATRVLLPFVLLLGLAAPARAGVGSLVRKANALERQGAYDDAVKLYQQALVLEPDNVRIHYNLGRALSEAKKTQEAASHFQLGLLSKHKELRANSLYNLGDCEYREKKLDEAIAMYSQALLLRPNDLQAKQNLEFCLKKKAEQKSQPDSTKKQQPKPQPKPQEQQQARAQPQKGAISKDQANRMLQAVQNKEKQNLKQRPRPQSQQAAGGKDW